MAPQDNHASKAKQHKYRIRPVVGGGFKAYRFKGYYVGYGSTMEQAHKRFVQILCELT